MSLHTFLHQRTVGEVSFDKKGLIEVEASTPLDKVLAELSSHSIRSVPVYKQQHAAGQKVYLGILTAFDIISLVAFGTQEEEDTREYRSDIDYASTPAEEVIGKLSEEDKRVWVFNTHDLLIHLCEAFGKGVHRALVHQKDDETGRPAIRLVSQSDVISFFVRHEADLKPFEPLEDSALELPTNKKLWNKTLEELGLCNPSGEMRKILDISTQDTAIHGFRMMAFSGIHALPVIDENKRVVTTLSVADLRAVNPEALNKILFSTVMEYLREVYGSNNTLHPVTVKPRDTLWSVMLKLSAAKTHKHQAWITDPDDRVLGVVSLSDILQRVYSEAKHKDKTHSTC